MADERRDARERGRSGARGRSGPGRSVRSGRAGKGDQRRQAQREQVVAAAAGKAREHSRLTGRAAILVLVLALLAVSFASSARAYLQQRGRLDALEERIAASKAEIEELEMEKQRWEDPWYSAKEARERFGYVPVGETPFVVIGEDGRPLGSEVELGEPAAPDDERTWIDDAWASMKVAGNPPTRIPAPPKTRISE